MALGLKVIDETTGGNLSFIKAGFRDTLGRLISILLLGVGILMVIFRSDKKAGHDLMFGSGVIKS